MRTKAEIRQGIWDSMKRNGVARSPGAHGRIPNFEGAEAAARRLSQLELWKMADVLKCNPDSPQRPVREAALHQGKIVYMAVPRLRERRCFVELDPARLGKIVSRAATIKGAFRYGHLMALDDMRPIDMVIAGSVAVNREGGRVGKGGGYSDLEYALGRTFGLIDETTPVVTTVHASQVLEESLPQVIHDIPVDYVITPEGVIETHHRLTKPEGIYWELLPEEKIAAIPILQKLRSL
ncbi:MAG: 5-formyltetrahydrofolate cyclo-ligase [Anaerolineales bacterium]|nr:5-formyltetrahydrofolate cyclo-ligase [Anaerolineales bacterium]